MIETRELLRDIAFDPELTPGARNAIESCLRIQPHEKVTLITDRACQEIGASVARELERLGILFNAFILEDLVTREFATQNFSEDVVRIIGRHRFLPGPRR